MRNIRRLEPAAIKALQDAVTLAMAKVREEVSENRERLADIYAGRDNGGILFFSPPPVGGVPVDTWVHELKSGLYTRGSATANLLTSRLIQIWVSAAPGRPRFLVEPRTPGALAAAETQETISAVALSGSRLEDAVRHAAWLDPIQNYVGVKMARNLHSQDDTDKIQWQVIGANDCGEEPFSCRFSWHARVEQWGSIDDRLRKQLMAALPESAAEPNAWDPVALVEVYDESFALETGDATRKGCRVHVFFNPAGGFYKDKRNKRPDLGVYAVTYDITACPLVIESNMERGPDDAVAPVEAVNWLGLLDAISDCAEQIRRNSNHTNRIILYDKNAIPSDVIQKVVNTPAANDVFLPVNTMGNGDGISHKMRPVERDSILADLINTLQTYFALLDDVTGVGPQDRGLSINPSKSATEASVLSASSSRRTAARLRTQIRRWVRCLRVLFEYQRDIFGEYLEVPLDGVVRKYRVPDPKTARYAFDVSLDEMENLSRRGRMDTQMMAHQLIVNHAVAFAQVGESLLAAESLRRTLRALGWHDAEAYTTARMVLGSPEDRYTKMLESGRDFPVDDTTDDPTRFIAFLGAKMEEAVATGNENIPVDKLQQAITRYQVILRQRDAAGQVRANRTGVVPGVNAQGEFSNTLGEQLKLGMVPRLSAQDLQ